MSKQDDPKDWDEAFRRGYDPFETANKAWAEPDAEPEPEAQPDPGVVTAADFLAPIDLKDFFEKELPARALIMVGLLFEKSTNMIYAWRGTGKTWFSLWLAYALATAKQFLKWKAEKTWKVIYIDGEMPAADLRDRMKKIVAANDGVMPAEGYFRLLPADMYKWGIPNLAQRDGQAAVEALIGDSEIVFFDNVGSWAKR